MIYWNFEYDGEMHDIQCDTKQEAQNWADEWFDERWSEETGTVEDEGFLVEFSDEVDEDFAEISREKIALEYVYEKSDFEEHNVWHSGGGGVL